MKLVKIIGIALATSVSAACATPQLHDVYWKLTKIDSAAVPAMAAPNEAHLQFTGADAVAGSTGCNRFMGNYVRQGNNLRFGKIAATRRFCAETADLESVFLAMLEKVTAYEFKGNRLIFLADGKTVAEWEARPAQPVPGQK